MYVGLLFVSTFAAAFPFGFVKGFQEARGNPLSENTLVLMKRFEWGLEALTVIAITTLMSLREPEIAVKSAIYAYITATIISYILDVCVFHSTMKEFVLRTVIGFLGCLPLGLLVASYANRGT